VGLFTKKLTGSGASALAVHPTTTPRWGKCLVTLVALIGLCLGGSLLMPSPAAFALQPTDPLFQPSPGPVAPSPLPINRVNADATARVIRVMKGRSQIIQFGTPITRVSIADPGIADIVPLAPDQIMINGRQHGTTSLVIWDTVGQQGIFDLTVPNDASELLEAIQALGVEDELNVRLTEDSLVISGQVSDSVILDEVRRLAGAFGYKDDKFVDLTETPAPQVSLTVKIAEASRSTLKDFKVGIALQQPGSGIYATKTDSFTSGGAAQAGNLTTASLKNAGGLFGAVIPDLGKRIGLAARFDLLETAGKVKLLAEPNLVCTHGRTASFLAGGEFPFVSSVNQNGTPVIQFKEFGVKLKFTPWIATRNNRIELRIQPEVSNIDPNISQTAANGQIIFGLASRKSDTTVELQDGESFMIAGLFNKQDSDRLAKIPWAGDLPVIGPFFRNTERNREDKELIIIVTPHIIRPKRSGQTAAEAVGTAYRGAP
jgi:pilus assembly protein CpaC